MGSAPKRARMTPYNPVRSARALTPVQGPVIGIVEILDLGDGLSERRVGVEHEVGANTAFAAAEIPREPVVDF